MLLREQGYVRRPDRQDMPVVRDRRDHCAV